MQCIRNSALLCILQLLASNAYADCVDYDSFARQIGLYACGHVLDVKVSGNNAYLACQLGSNGYQSGNGFKIIDVTDPASPRLTSYLDLPAPRDIALAGSYALVADAMEDLVVIDISGGSSLVSKLQLPGESKAIAAWGTFAFVGLDVGLRKIDLTTPASPQIVRFLSTRGPVQALFQSENLLYVAEEGSGMEVIDPNLMTVIGHVDTRGSWGVTVSGNFAFVANYQAGVEVIDVSDPHTPHVVGNFDAVTDPSWPYDGAFDLTVIGNLLVIAHGDGLRILDISNPMMPAPICRVQVAATMWSVVANNNYAYLGGERGLFVFDIHNPYSAPILAQSVTPFANSVTVSGTHAYIADGEAGLRILDITDPTLPTPTGGYGTDVGGCVDIAVLGDRAYVASQRRGLLIFDVSDPTNPMLLGNASTPNHAVRSAVDAGFAYVTDDTAGLLIFDVSNPASPNLVSRVSTIDLAGGYVGYIGSALGVAVRDGYAYLAEQDGYPNQDHHSRGFYVIDVSKPARPVIVSRRRDLPYTSSVELSGHYAYVTNNGYNFALYRQVTDLMVIDVSIPASPVVVGSVPSGGGRLSVDGDVAYVSNSLAGVGVFDVSDPQFPSFIGRVSPDYATSDVEAGSGFVYAAQGPLGLVVLPAQCPSFVPVSPVSLQAVSSREGILLTWTTQNELDQVGFYVDRSLLASGPYERVTTSLIPSQKGHRYLDSSAPVGRTLFYKLEAVDRDGRTSFFGPVSAFRQTSNVPTTLGVCHPNPFGAAHAFTTLEFSLPHSSRVRVFVLDATGRQVRLVSDGNLDPGPHASKWDGRNDRGDRVAPGVYFYRLDTDEYSGSRMLLRIP